MNESLAKQLQANIDAFTANMHAIVTQAVRDAIDEAARSVPKSKGAPSKTSAVTVATPGAGKRPTHGRGSSVDVDTVLKEVKRQGGRGVEALAKSLRVKTKQLQLPLRKLVETRKIKTKGQRRGMRYTAA
jgi:hypothetical protein